MTLNSPQFTKINESFHCLHCGFETPKAQSTCRDHCPQCLYSLHVDNNPGDRAAQCGGLLVPFAYSQNRKKGIMIHYRCARCSVQKQNRFLEMDDFCPDNYTALLNLG